jgi:hypothetical protein
MEIDSSVFRSAILLKLCRAQANVNRHEEARLFIATAPGRARGAPCLACGAAWRKATGERGRRRWVPEDGVADDPSPAMALTHPRTPHACGDAQALANCQQAYDVLTVDRSAGFFISPVKKREALEVSQSVSRPSAVQRWPNGSPACSARHESMTAQPRRLHGARQDDRGMPSSTDRRMPDPVHERALLISIRVRALGLSTTLMCARVHDAETLPRLRA